VIPDERIDLRPLTAEEHVGEHGDGNAATNFFEDCYDQGCHIPIFD
jgi:hypothetical protein